jgi:hypothetical protein
MTHHYTNCHSCANDTVYQRKEENNEEDETRIGKTRGQSDAEGSKPFFSSPPERSLAKKTFGLHSLEVLARDIKISGSFLEARGRVRALPLTFALAVFLNASVGGFYALRATDVVVVARGACFFAFEHDPTKWGRSRSRTEYLPPPTAMTTASEFWISATQKTTTIPRTILG